MAVVVPTGKHPQRMLAIGAGGLALLLTACTGLSLDTTNAVGPAPYESDSPAISAPVEYETLPEPALSPLDDYLTLLGEFRNFNSLDEDTQRRVWDAREARIENHVADCMHRFGFEYLPNPGLAQFIPAGDNDAWRPQERRWVSQWGYAFVSRPTAWGSSQPSFVFDSNYHGPNEAILGQLDESEREAWDGARWGSLLAGEHGLGFFSDYQMPRPTEFPDEISNCGVWGRLQVELEEDAVINTDEFRPLMEAINRLRQDLRDDISPADQAWAQCMSSAGFPGFARQWDASAQINLEFNELNTGELTPANSPEMAALQEREIELALADFDCRVATDFATKLEAHRIATETQFVSDHREELAALRHAAELGTVSERQAD